MMLSAKFVVTALLALVVWAPAWASDHCDDSHPSGEHAACACVCCAESAIENDDSAAAQPSPVFAHIRVAGIIFVGRLPMADIFRPPAAV
ncbi:MAG: hypothetical protein KBA51_02540 [Kiritimatiellae bacterium]|nr:hypothetical protein [Kiritimatiellia bacterium]